MNPPLIPVPLEIHMNKANGWQDATDPQQLLNLAKARLAQSGWDAVRPALTVIVRWVHLIHYVFPSLNIFSRGWIIRGFVGEEFGYPQDEVVDFFKRVVDFLELGRREWPNVHKDNRGVIFEMSFIQGVKRLHLNAYVVVREPCDFVMLTWSWLFIKL